MLPASLHYPANPLNISSCWVQLSEELFGELSAALEAPAPPDAAALRAEFEKWQQFVPAPGPNVVDKSTVASWLQAYAIALEQRETANDAYTSSVARLLRGKSKMTAVPFVVAWQNKSAAQVLKLEMVSVSAGAGGFWFHPSFANRRADMQAETGQFLAAITAAWASACSQCPQPVAVDVFWRLTTDDGGALPAIQLDGPSASAAAFRAFWHITRALQIDPDVYVLADATSSNGRIEAVGQLRGKINCIQATQSLRNACPPTLVAARRLSDDDLAAFRGASEWAEVVHVATVEELIAVRSCAANTVIAYMEHLAEKLDETPWTRDGKPVRLSDVHVPPQVWKDEYSFHPTAETDARTEQRDWRPAGYDPADADREVAPRLKQQRRKVLLPWKSEFARPQHQPIVIVGGPGLGKTSLLRWTAREIVLDSLCALRERTKTWQEVRWPIIADLAGWLSKGGDPHDTLRDAALDFVTLPKTHPRLQRETLPHVLETRLIAQIEHTHLLLDALDQVPATKLRLLRGRLAGLGSVTTRLVLSTRGAALTTHLPLLPFRRLTTLEAAALPTADARALAAKWLGAKLATRLETHLHAQPAMSVVADSPLLLTFACGIIDRSPDAELPQTTAYLYRDLMQSLACGQWRDAGTDADSPHDPDAFLAQLHLMAWRLFSRDVGTNRFSRDTLIRALNDGSRSADIQADATLSQLCRLGFLERSGQNDGEPYFQFRHTTFLEFLAAAHLAAEINAESWAQAKVTRWRSENGWRLIKLSELLDANAFEPAWEPLFAFTAGLVRQPKPLLEMLADRTKDDIYTHRLRLLCQCYGSLAPEKECGLEGLLDEVIPVIDRMVSRACSGFDFKGWEDWFTAAIHLLKLPKAAQRISSFFTQYEMQVCSGHEGHNYHYTVDILSKAAQNLQCKSSMEVLLLICETETTNHWKLGDAATKAVELAERLALPQVLQRLEQMMDAAGEKPYHQVEFARALLRVSDTRLAQRAFDLLSAISASNTLEKSCRSMAVESFIETLDTRLEDQGIAKMLSYLLDPSRFDSEDESAGIIWDILTAAGRYRSKSTLALQREILSKFMDGGLGGQPWGAASLPRVPEPSKCHFLLAKDLVRWDDPAARTMGTQLLLYTLRKASRGQPDDTYHALAAEILIECGDDSEREEALASLVSILRTPMRILFSRHARLDAANALLKVGHAYNDEIRQCVCECSTAPDSEFGSILFAAEIAKKHCENDLVDVFLPRLRRKLDEYCEVRLLEDYCDAERIAALCFGTREWNRLEEYAFTQLRSSAKNDECDFFCWVVRFGAKSSKLIELAEELLHRAKRRYDPYLDFGKLDSDWSVALIRELDLRGWRFQLSRRKLVILRAGKDERRCCSDEY